MTRPGHGLIVLFAVFASGLLPSVAQAQFNGLRTQQQLDALPETIRLARNLELDLNNNTAEKLLPRYDKHIRNIDTLPGIPGSPDVFRNSRQNCTSRSTPEAAHQCMQSVWNNN